MYSWVANDLGISEDIATEYAKSVRAYSSAFYTPIRELQRGEEIGGKFNIEEVEKYSNNIETYIRKAHRWNGGETFRGISVSFEDRRQHKPGYIVDMGGTSSWTSKKSVAEDFATCTTNFKRPGSIIYHCKTQSKGTGIRHMSEYDNEEEVIVSKEAKYEVIKTMKDEEGITHVYLKEVE